MSFVTPQAEATAPLEVFAQAYAMAGSELLTNSLKAVHDPSRITHGVVSLRHLATMGVPLADLMHTAMIDYGVANTFHEAHPFDSEKTANFDRSRADVYAMVLGGYALSGLVIEPGIIGQAAMKLRMSIVSAPRFMNPSLAFEVKKDRNRAWSHRGEAEVPAMVPREVTRGERYRMMHNARQARARHHGGSFLNHLLQKRSKRLADVAAD